jgi:UDP-N-acetylglucosamine 4,6-dehydratase
MMRPFDTPAPDLDGKTILVTGGTGSYGEKFAETVLQRYKPAKLIIYSRDEQKQYEMEQRLPIAKHECLRYFIGDVRDIARLKMAMRGVDYVVHAAALKIVPTAEYNPFECINTNVIGAQNVVTAAIEANVQRVVNVSTDKAVNPINLYGASKLAAEKIMTAANSLSGKGGTRFATVRYGNVIGSRGSVVPLFRRLLDEGVTELPITDERMTRFWITLQQGVNFVLSCLSQMKGGEVFVPKIPSMNIMDLVRAMSPDVETRTIGVRPGEKLHELLLIEEESRHARELDDRYVVLPEHISYDATAFGDKTPPPGFVYASDNNVEWLDQEALRGLL